MKRVRTALSAALLFLTTHAVLDAQQPREADVKSIDGIMRAFYEVVSTPAGGSPDFKRDSSLHVPAAQIRMSRTAQDGTARLQTLTLGRLHEMSGGVRKEGSYEREIHRVVQQFGHIATVWSTYVISSTPNGPAIDRGISSVALYFDGKRWWITGWADEGETPKNPIPDAFLPKAKR